MTIKEQLLTWDIYEITSKTHSIHGVMFRGRLRKFAIKQYQNILCENASDKDNCVRFALLHNNDNKFIQEYIKQICPDAKIDLIQKELLNPILSKLKVNIKSRYTL